MIDDDCCCLHGRTSSHVVTLPSELRSCSNCTLRLLKQALNRGPNVLFWSCAEVDIVPLTGPWLTFSRCMITPTQLITAKLHGSMRSHPLLSYHFSFHHSPLRSFLIFTLFHYYFHSSPLFCVTFRFLFVVINICKGLFQLFNLHDIRIIQHIFQNYFRLRRGCRQCLHCWEILRR